MASIMMNLTGDILVTSFLTDGIGAPSPGIKKEVSEFTQRSRSALCRYLRGAEAVYRNMLTLTLPAEFDNDEAKGYLKAMIERLRRQNRNAINADTTAAKLDGMKNENPSTKPAGSTPDHAIADNVLAITARKATVSTANAATAAAPNANLMPTKRARNVAREPNSPAIKAPRNGISEPPESFRTL